MSDLPWFEALENTVAINADETLERTASVAYRGESLWDAYALGRGLLERRG